MEKEGSLRLLTGLSSRATIMGEEGSSQRLPISERKTSELRMLLYCTRENKRKTLSAANGGEGALMCCIIGPGLGCQLGQKWGWGTSRGRDQQGLE